MPISSVGDMAQQYNTMRNGSTIKLELSGLAESMSSGRVTDVVQHLGGETAQLSGINHTLSRLDAYITSGGEIENSLANMQLVLGQIDTISQETSSQLLLINSNASEGQVTEASRTARSNFDTMVNLLNTRVGDRALFGGADVENTPLASADDMLGDIVTAIGGATSQAAISAAIDTWFDDPSGGFATMGYQGDTGAVVERRISGDTTISVDARADDIAIRSTLKFAALAAIADEMPALDLGTRSGLLQEAGIGLFSASSELVNVQARVGSSEGTITRELTEMSAQSAVLQIAKNDLVSVDPFDTASRLQAVQLQLETHYAVTARMSQLSLLSYL
ncbi:flagellar hook-associated protein 3 FlgL [Yoonia maritima]|uniref:Flagellar hook-associated protein 3 FlgL n=1 Tax=Yoonia maritima TaxID=1435347 RepID=A0A2T0VZ62_9RHOB|nr:flagellin [Yoonia maritima]PRY77623.1 flagellar hook-associated protein 3 FlgL [Yoonia maritima]